ncbi:CotH kinase family protein [Eubacterium sp.]|uniref:CotH kinase family protein n=1 Tax=Eubacterium sp. TaxID=142586 RepID=UPI0025CF3CDB|nr:CotH kinase family protein [Eubacterium sp.]MCR5628418.1 CotH kinase family protein [Eubacterium sp.]
MRDMSKFSRTAVGISKKAVAIAIAFAMSLPNVAFANDVSADSGFAQTEENFDENEEFHADHMQEIIDEAEAMGVPNAFIRHYLAKEVEEGKIAAPAEELSFKNATSKDGVVGLETDKVKLATLANTKIDLGEFDFGEYEAANMIYNFAVSKNVKCKVLFYLGDSEEAFAEGEVKKSITNDPWSKTRSLAIDVSDKKFTGKKHLYVKFIADSVINPDGSINNETTDEGIVYLESLFFTEGSTPVVSFDIDKEVNTMDSINGSSVHTTMGYGTMNVNVPEGYKSPISKEKLTDKIYELEYVKGRGNSTWLQSKKPYKIKLEDSEELLGMPANKHWALLANYFDYTLLRNRYTFYLAEKLGLNYTPESIAVDVVMDGEYYGSYQLSETIRIDKNRIEIDDLDKEENPTDPENITGGYLLSHGSGWLKDEKLPKVLAGEKPLYIEKPEFDRNTEEEVKEAEIDYMNNYLAEIDEAINNIGSNDEGVVDWRTLLDEDSLITYTLMQEFSNNGDAYRGSTYYYKPRNGKLYCGPVWDFDFVAWGAESTESERWEEFNMLYMAPWFSDIYKKDEEFRNKVCEKWAEFSDLLKETIKDDGYLDEMARGTYMSALANYQTVSSYLIDGINYWSFGEPEHFECYDKDGNPYTLNYFNEVNRLKEYIEVNIKWVDKQIDSIMEISSEESVDNVEFYVDDKLYEKISMDSYNVEGKRPKNPKKEGYEFVGWYTKDNNGDEIELATNIPIQTYVYDDELKIKVYSPRKFYAKFIKKSEAKEIESLSFIKNSLCIPLTYNYGDEEEGETAGYIAETVRLKHFLNIKPNDDLKNLVKWEIVDEKGNLVNTDNAFINDEGVVEIKALGTYYIKASYKKVDAIIKLVVVDCGDVIYPSKMTTSKSLEMEVGDTAQIDIKFDKEDKIPYYLYDMCKYIVEDESIVRVDGLGKVKAKKAGETTVITMLDLSDETLDGAILIVETNIKVKEKAVKTDIEKRANAPKIGTVLKDGTYSYKITKVASDDKKVAGEVSFTGALKKNIKKITVKSTVVIDGYKYKVTSISNKACVNLKNLYKLTISKNVKTIGAKAFFGIKNLKSVSIESKKIRKIGKKAFFRKGGKKVTFKVVKVKKKAYKKLLKNAKTNNYKVK